MNGKSVSREDVIAIILFALIATAVWILIDHKWVDREPLAMEQHHERVNTTP